MDSYITPLDVRVYMALALPPILFSSWIRSLKYLAPVSGVANFLMALGLAVTIYYSSQDLPSITERQAFAGWKTLPLFFGTAIYAFEGIGLVNISTCYYYFPLLRKVDKFALQLLSNRIGD
jgi:solute carrier family 36 (proton-coupled amino acid transporter)